MTSFAFMFVLVPEPVWNTSIGKVRVVLACGDLGRGRVDGGGHVGLQQIEARVGAGRGLLHEPERADEAAGHREAADREILDGSLGLGAPQGIGRDRQLAHAVALGTERRRHGFTARISLLARWLVSRMR